MNHIDEMKLHEYDSLRAELRENKRFIFERAAITIIGILALIKIVGEPVIYILPTVAIGLLVYNLLFTTTRFKSSAHIVAMLIRFHEGDLKKEWIGWETYLFYYRTFIKNDKVRERVTKEMHDRFKKNLNRYLFNYDRIFAFHIYTILGFMLFSFYSIGDIFFDLNLMDISNKMFWMKITLTALNIFLSIYVITKKEIRPKSVVTSIQYFYIMCEEIVNNKKLIRQIIQGS